MTTDSPRHDRRHFMQHLAGAAALAVPAMSFTNALAANAADLKKNGTRRPSCCGWAAARRRSTSGT